MATEKNIHDKISIISGLNITKNSTNPHFQSQYATYDHIMETLRPLLVDNGLQIFHYTKDKEIVTMIRDTSGQIFQSFFPLPETDNVQKQGGAITYARRYNVCQIFDIMLDDDIDGNVVENPLQKNAVEAIKEVFYNKNESSDCTHENTTFKEGIGKNGKPYKMNKCNACSHIAWVN